MEAGDAGHREAAVTAPRPRHRLAQAARARTACARAARDAAAGARSGPALPLHRRLRALAHAQGGTAGAGAASRAHAPRTARAGTQGPDCDTMHARFVLKAEEQGRRGASSLPLLPRHSSFHPLPPQMGAAPGSDQSRALPPETNPKRIRRTSAQNSGGSVMDAGRINFVTEEAAIDTVLSLTRDEWLAFRVFLQERAAGADTVGLAPREHGVGPVPDGERRRQLVAALRTGAERHRDQPYNPHALELKAYVERVLRVREVIRKLGGQVSPDKPRRFFAGAFERADEAHRRHAQELAQDQHRACYICGCPSVPLYCTECGRPVCTRCSLLSGLGTRWVIERGSAPASTATSKPRPA